MSVAAFSRPTAAGTTTFRALLLASLFALGACSGDNTGGLFNNEPEGPSTDAIEPERPAAELYNQGLAFMAEGNTRRAIESFQEVDRQHPYSDEARKAHIMTIFAHYRGRDYTDAISAGNRYLVLYPSSADAAYAQYLVGESYFRQMPDVTRDQEAAQRALIAFRAIIDNYPTSEYAADAQTKITVIEDQLAGKEMQIGRYYLERREYVAAINRFRYVVENYQATRHIEEALLRLVETYLSMGLTSEAQAAAAVLGHNFPNSQWYLDALALLQPTGLQPQASEGSWLSRLFT